MSSNGSAGSSGEIRFGSKPLSTDVHVLQGQLKATILERRHWRKLTESTQHQIAQMDAQHLMARQQQEQRIVELQQQVQALQVELSARRDSVASASSSPPRSSADPRIPEAIKVELQRLHTELAASHDACNSLTAQMAQRDALQQQQDQLQNQHWMENLEKLFQEKEEAVHRAQQLEKELQEIKQKDAGASSSIVLPAQPPLEERKEAETPCAMDIEASPQTAATKSAVPLSEPLSRLSSVESVGCASSAQSVSSSPAPVAAAASASASPSVAGVAIKKMFRLPPKTKAPVAAQSAAAVVTAAVTAAVAVNSTVPSQSQLREEPPQVSLSSVPASSASDVSSAIPSPPATPHSSAPFAAAVSTPLPRSGGGKRFSLTELKKRDSSALLTNTPSNISPQLRIDMANHSPSRATESHSAHSTPSTASSSFQSPPSFSLPPQSPALHSASCLRSAASPSILSVQSSDELGSSAAKRPRTIQPCASFQLSPGPPLNHANSPDLFAEMPPLCR